MSEQTAHSDIRREGFIAKLPASWQPYAVLMRLDRPIGWWLLLIPSYWGMALAGHSLLNHSIGFWITVILFWIGAIIMRGAGCVINDLWDRNLDKQVTRTQNRPLASGELDLMQGLAFLCALLFIGFAILLMMNGAVIMLGLMVVPLIVIYPLMKRHTWWPQAFLGITFNFGALMGWATVVGDVHLGGFLLYCSCILWTLGYDTIYAHQDKEDDLMAGIKSTALYFGDNSPQWVGRFYIGSFVLLALSIIVAQGLSLTLPLLFIPGFYLWIMLKSWDENSEESSLRVFKDNRNYGLIVLAVLILGSELSQIVVTIFEKIDFSVIF